MVKRVASYIEAMTEEAVMLTQQAGNTDILKLEKDDLRALTVESFLYSLVLKWQV